MDPGSTTSELVATRNATIETLVQGESPVLVVLPSYGRDGIADFDRFANLIACSELTFCSIRPFSHPRLPNSACA
jgi:hypothetical protein